MYLCACVGGRGRGEGGAAGGGGRLKLFFTGSQPSLPASIAVKM